MPSDRTGVYYFDTFASQKAVWRLGVGLPRPMRMDGGSTASPPTTTTSERRPEPCSSRGMSDMFHEFGHALHSLQDVSPGLEDMPVDFTGLRRRSTSSGVCA